MRTAPLFERIEQCQEAIGAGGIRLRFERAVRMVREHERDCPSQWKAIQSIAEKLDINHETLRIWVRRAETDVGQRPGLTTDERAPMKALENENRELRRANEILKAAFGEIASRGEVPSGPWRSLRTRISPEVCGSPQPTVSAKCAPDPSASSGGLRRDLGCVLALSPDRRRSRRRPNVRGRLPVVPGSLSLGPPTFRKLGSSRMAWMIATPSASATTPTSSGSPFADGLMHMVTSGSSVSSCASGPCARGWDVRRVVAHVISYEAAGPLELAGMFRRAGLRADRVNDHRLRTVHPPSPRVAPEDPRRTGERGARRCAAGAGTLCPAKREGTPPRAH